MSLGIDPKLVSAGLLVEGDYVSLSAGVKIEGRTIHDAANNAQHTIHPRVVFLLERLQTGMTIDQWLQLAKKRKIRPAETYDIICFLNDIAALQITRPRRFTNLKLLMFRIRLAGHGLRRERRARRWPANILGVSCAVTRACGVLMVLAPVTAFLLYGMGVSAGEAIVYASGSFGLVWLTTVVHECVHSKYARHDSAVVVQQGMRIGVVHAQSARGLERFSAICGPLFGAGLGIVGGIFLAWFARSEYFSAIGVGVASAHLWSWAPWYGDGKILWDVQKNKHLQEELRGNV